MATSTDETSACMQLRKEAEARLTAGTAGAYSKWSLGVDALNLLHRLSSDPDTAADALKLLHELQVHQVELDLQTEEMHANEQRLVDECARYTEMYQFAPFGYFLVDFQGEIAESNRAGAELFGLGQGEAADGRIDRFLAAESRSVLLDLLKKLAEDGVTQTCEVTADGGSRPFRMMVKASSDKRCALLACCEPA